MKKSNFLTGSLKPISRNELRKIAGGTGRGCPPCGSPFLSSGTGRCAFVGPNGQICRGTVIQGQCCI
ncbi:hypothetical protein [Ascidiimonas aurantiaca]|uniref:hypothetical protein n=1 Tax=Ascidiimonas aurantiaca TaxID=1685432 RepID=UPI0030EC747F